MSAGGHTATAKQQNSTIIQGVRTALHHEVDDAREQQRHLRILHLVLEDLLVKGSKLTARIGDSKYWHPR